MACGVSLKWWFCSVHKEWGTVNHGCDQQLQWRHCLYTCDLSVGAELWLLHSWIQFSCLFSVHVCVHGGKVAVGLTVFSECLRWFLLRVTCYVLSFVEAFHFWKLKKIVLVVLGWLKMEKEIMYCMDDPPLLFGFIHSLVYKILYWTICPNFVVLLYYLLLICREGRRS